MTNIMAQYSPERIQIYNTIMNVCSNYPEWAAMDVDLQKTLVRRIERGCFEFVINECILNGIDRLFTEKKFIDRYSVICYKVIINLDVNGSIQSSELINKIINNVIDPHDVAKLSSKNMCFSANEKERNYIELRQNQQTITKVSTKYTCMKCHKNETIFKSYQSKTADESENTSIKCVSCGNVWGF